MTKHNQRASDNATISSVTYNVNKIGQRESVAQTFQSASSTPTTANIQWGYNATGEVTKADHSDTAQNRAYNYDGIGNRLTSSAGVSPASSTTYTSNALNQYTSISGGAFQAPSPDYDDDGNATAYPLPINPTTNATLIYDGENRLIEIVTGSTTVVYRYDAQSRRIAKSVGTASNTFFIYDYWNCIGEYTGANHFKCYTWGMDMSGRMQGAGGVGGLLAIHDGSASYFPTYDGNGNISEYLDANGITQAHYEYDAFGNTVVSTGAKANDFTYRFSTKPLDAESGLYYYGYRFYDLLTGRWINRDPIQESGGLNLYNFVGNDPMFYIDLLGLCGRELKVTGEIGFAKPIAPPYLSGGGKANGKVDYDTCDCCYYIDLSANLSLILGLKLEKSAGFNLGDVLNVNLGFEAQLSLAELSTNGKITTRWCPKEYERLGFQEAEIELFRFEPGISVSFKTWARVSAFNFVHGEGIFDLGGSAKYTIVLSTKIGDGYADLYGEATGDIRYRAQVGVRWYYKLWGFSSKPEEKWLINIPDKSFIGGPGGIKKEKLGRIITW